MDLYNLFRASAQASKVRLARDNTRSSVEKPAGKGGTTKNKEDRVFDEQARQLIKDIARLRDFLMANRKQYVNIDHWLDGACLMTDYERDRIDSQSQTLITSYKNVLKHLSKAASVEKRRDQTRHHREAVVEIVTDFLTAVSKLCSEQRAIRVQRTIENRKLLRLENLVSYNKHISEEKPPLPSDGSFVDKENSHSLTARHSAYSEGQNTSSQAVSENTGSRESNVRRRRTSKTDFPRAVTDEISDDRKSQKIIQKTMHQRVKKEKLAALEADVEHSKQDWERISHNIRPEEKVQLEMEGKNLRQEFTAKVDEIKKLEGSVVEIANLQGIFTEKILQQSTDVYRINDIAILTTENIRMANEAIRQAMKKQAFMRVFIIFTLIVLSFTLLFLDWYND